MFASIATGNTKPFTLHLAPNLTDLVNREVLSKHPSNLRLERYVTALAQNSEMDPAALRYAYDRLKGA